MTAPSASHAAAHTGAAVARAGGLARQLGLVSLVALVIGEVIAVGIFLTPAGMAKALGSPVWLLGVWIVMGAMALCGAWCYGELAAGYPEAGGGYVYLREAYGPAVAFLYGWKCLLVMDPGVTAALAVGLATYVGYSLDLSPLGLKAVGIGGIALLALVNIVGVRIGAGIIRWLTALKLVALALIVILAFALGRGEWANFSPLLARRPGSESLLPALAGGFVGAFFAFGGWWEVSKLAGEAREPGRTVPRALALGVVIVTLAYILTSAAFWYLVPVEEVTSGETFAAQAGAALFGPAGGQVLAIVVIVSVLGALATLLMALPRVYFAMARDGLFFRGVGAVSGRFGTPARAILIQATLASVLVAIGTFEEILAYFIFVTVVFISLTVAGVYVIRRRERARDGRDAPGPAALPAEPVSGGPVFRTPGYPVTPAVFLALAAVLLFLLAAGNPIAAVLGIGVVALGWPVYRLLFRGP